jgi:hypothetical protein
MRCFYHHDREAVAGCKNCSRGVCPDCAVDVGNGIACRNRCEEEVRALNELIQQNRGAYARTRSAYARTALFYVVVGALLAVGGLLDWRGYGQILLPAGGILIAAGYLYYSTGRRYS